MLKRGRTPDPLSPDLPEEARLFAEELRRLYLRAAWTLRELAAKTQISKSAWSRYLTGQSIPPADRLEQFAKVTRPTSTEWKELQQLWKRAQAVTTINRHTKPGTTPPTGTDSPDQGTGDGTGEGTGDSTDDSTDDAVVPRQLPGAVRHFVGRTAELQALSTLVEETTGTGGMVVISAIDGTAGIGKTAIAVHWAHQIAQEFPDGQLYVNLRGFDPSGTPVKPTDAIRGFLDAFAIPPERIPATPHAQANLYRSLLAGKRVLVVLDNARDTDQVRPLLPGSPTCLAVVTSRNQLTGLVATEGAHPITLDLLTDPEAQELLTRHLGPERVTAEPEAVAELIERCARLPLALSITAARAATHPQFPLHQLAAELRDQRGRLDTLNTGDTATEVRAVFSWSYQHLTTEAARLFRLLGIHPGPDITTPAAASLTGTPVSQTRKTLTELTRTHLITQHTPGRFAFHDLLRAYATEQAHTHTHDTDVERHTAAHRMLDHYLHTAHTAAMLLHPNRDPITLTPPQPGTTAEDLTDHEQALAWYEAEHRVLLAAIQQAATTGFDTHAWQLAWTLATFFDRRGHWQDWVATGHTALAAVQRLADQRGQARVHYGLGSTYGRMGHYDDAHTHHHHALDLYRELDDPIGQARTHLNFSWVLNEQDRHGESLAHAEAGLDLYHAAGHRAGQAIALNAIGWCHAQLGDHQQALTYCEQALTLQRELDDRRGQARTLDSIGYAHHHLGHHQQAVVCYQQALDLLRELGDRYNEAMVLTHLGDTHHAAGNPDTAGDTWRHALDILNDLGHPNADQVRTKLTGLDERATPDQTAQHDASEVLTE